MSYDDWTNMVGEVWREVADKVDAFEGSPRERASWMEKELSPLFKANTDGLAFYRAFERAALAFYRYDALTYAADNQKNDVRTAYQAWLRGGFEVPQAVKQLQKQLGLLPPAPERLVSLPRYSAYWSFPICLDTDFLSQDDISLYPIDNPVRKEHVLKVPMMAASSWKGALRAAFRESYHLADGDPTVERLFGHTRANPEGAQAGQLFCFPSYFNRLGLMVINVHDRQEGIGARGPILFETAPAGSEGWISLLYVPRFPIETAQIATDLRHITTLLVALLRIYGFGAKTSSGFGRVTERLPAEGSFAIHKEDRVPPAEDTRQSTSEELARYLESPQRLIEELRTEDGSLIDERGYQQRIEEAGQSYNKKNKQLYQKAQGWWDREGKALHQTVPTEPEPPPPPPPLIRRSFRTLQTMTATVEEVASGLIGDEVGGTS